MSHDASYDIIMREQGVVKATTADEADNLMCDYLREGGAALSYIRVNPQTGEIQIKSPGGLKVVIVRTPTGMAITRC